MACLAPSLPPLPLPGWQVPLPAHHPTDEPPAAALGSPRRDRSARPIPQQGGAAPARSSGQEVKMGDAPPDSDPNPGFSELSGFGAGLGWAFGRCGASCWGVRLVGLAACCLSL